MEIGHFVSYSKEPEGLCSAGCAFIACYTYGAIDIVHLESTVK